MQTEQPRPLLVTSDPGITDAVLAVASEARVELTVADDPGSAVGLWTSAPLVLIDADQVEAVAALPPRPGVVAVARAIDDVDSWRRLTGLGIERIVELPQGAPWLFERLGQARVSHVRDDLLAVVGAAGGAGTSTLAAALAHHINGRARSAVLVDLDPSGGGIDLLLGGENDPGARWGELAGVSGHVDERILMSALPVTHRLPHLSWPAEGVAEPDDVAVGHILDAMLRSGAAVVADVGRGTDSRSRVALSRAKQVMVVVPLRVRAVASARRMLQRLPKHPTPMVLAREPAPGGLSADDLAGALGVDAVLTLPHDRRRATVEEIGGSVPGSSQWRRLCQRLLATEVEVA